MGTNRVRAFAGIGSRATPPDVLELLRLAAQFLVSEGWVCRSGGAAGADQACEDGAIEALADHPAGGRLEVYLPWLGFGRGLPWYGETRDAALPPLALDCQAQPTPEAVALAATTHPNWAACSPAARKLHGRNSHQILGADLRSPVSSVVCWTPDGADGSPDFPITAATGGTGQALRLAHRLSIPVFNLQRPEHRARVLARLERG